jgi:hypothetical protein
VQIVGKMNVIANVTGNNLIASYILEESFDAYRFSLIEIKKHSSPGRTAQWLKPCVSPLAV